MITSSHRLPAEFERHTATWLLWPTRPDNWRLNGTIARNDMLALARLIARFERVRLGVPVAELEVLQNQLPKSVSVVEAQYDDT